MRLFRRVPENPDMEDCFELAVSDFLDEVHTCIPGRITKYDAATQKANVQPVVSDYYMDPDEEVLVAEKYPIIPCVPIVWPSSNDGASITFPLKKGDPVFLFFSERSVAEYLVNGALDNQPSSARAFDLSDGFAIPGGRSFNHSSGHAAPIPAEGFDERAVVVRGPEVHVRAGDGANMKLGADVMIKGSKIKIGSETGEIVRELSGVCEALGDVTGALQELVAVLSSASTALDVSGGTPAGVVAFAQSIKAAAVDATSELTPAILDIQALLSKVQSMQT